LNRYSGCWFHKRLLYAIRGIRCCYISWCLASYEGGGVANVVGGHLGWSYLGHSYCSQYRDSEQLCMIAGTNVFDPNFDLPRSSLSSKSISTTLGLLVMIMFQIMIRISAGSAQNCGKMIVFVFADLKTLIVWWIREGEPRECTAIKFPLYFDANF